MLIEQSIWKFHCPQEVGCYFLVKLPTLHRIFVLWLSPIVRAMGRVLLRTGNQILYTHKVGDRTPTTDGLGKLLLSIAVAGIISNFIFKLYGFLRIIINFKIRIQNSDSHVIQRQVFSKYFTFQISNFTSTLIVISTRKIWRPTTVDNRRPMSNHGVRTLHPIHSHSAWRHQRL